MIVQRVDVEGWTVDETAAAFGVSTRTVHKWRARARAEGLAGLNDRRSVPHRVPHQTRERRVAAILRLRGQRRRIWEIARRLRMARSTVAVIVHRHGCGRLPPVVPPPPVQRMNAPAPASWSTWTPNR